ncbi:MAG: protein-disulfide reductase DsbD family protein [Verrucomicrobia bacterium]|nr:protein-disulfide reductase DsbD family protein [Verrucomicrobiota bacterium]
MHPFRFLLSLAFCLPLLAQDPFEDPFAAAEQGQNGGSTSKAELLVDTKAIAPGTPFTISLKLTHPPGWHSYFHNDGIGISKIPTITWTLPEGFEADELQWPTPHQAEFVKLTTYGYEGTNIFSTTITPPDNLPTGGTVELSLTVAWQICKEGCNDEMFQQTVTLPVKETAEASPSVQEEIAAYNRKHLPLPAPEDWQVTASDSGEQITLRLTTGQELPDNLFFYDYNAQIDPQAKQAFTSPEPGVWQLVVARNKGNYISDDPGPVLPRLKGILAAETPLPGSERSAVWIESASPAAEPSPDTASSGSTATLFAVFGGMFLGGLILNLMPCVFPVIGLKIMSFVEQAGEDRRKITVHGIVFVAGVVLSFWVLAGLLLAGGLKNWGAQLENPWVVLTILLVMLALAMSMYGVFELGTSATGIGGKLARRGGLSGTFFSGILATVVATPCAGPFLGTAIGATLGLPTLQFMAAFTAMALGLGLPYLLLSVFPGLIRRLPRPGAWMESFKQGMSFLLFASVGYLLWVYSGQVFEQLDGRKGFNVVIGLSIFAAGLWVYGRWNVPARAARTRWIARGVTLGFLLGGFVLAMPSKSKNMWEPWSLQRQEELLEEGTPVYVDFTARWCVTCQSNKATAYSPEVKALLKEHDVVLLKADKTNPSAEIDNELRKLGKSAIPVNVLYRPDDKDVPHITETVLTPGYLEEFFHSLLDES